MHISKAFFLSEVMALIVLLLNSSWLALSLLKFQSMSSLFLSRPLDKDKLFQVLRDMGKGKSLGLDGLPCKLYLVLWPMTGYDLYRMS
jgi:hypothetical protein